MRTEVLNRLQSKKFPVVLVSYPDALAEKTVSKDIFQKNTLRLSVGEQVDRSFVAQVLESYRFQYVDYVYEPGQYAVRGSILDVFSFSSEYPFRIDFFGNEVETIRSFDVETQLSKEKLTNISIIPELTLSQSKNATLFDMLPPETIIGIEDIQWITSRIESINENELHIDPQEVDFVKADLISKDEFLSAIQPFKHIRFDSNILDIPDATLDFHTSPQPLFHKNFELLSESMLHFLDRDIPFIS